MAIGHSFSVSGVRSYGPEGDLKVLVHIIGILPQQLSFFIDITKKQCHRDIIPARKDIKLNNNFKGLSKEKSVFIKEGNTEARKTMLKLWEEKGECMDLNMIDEAILRQFVNMQVQRIIDNPDDEKEWSKYMA